jgi:hypothetical protein
VNVTEPSGIGPPDVTVAVRITRIGVTVTSRLEVSDVIVCRAVMLKFAPAFVIV